MIHYITVIAIGCRGDEKEGLRTALSYQQVALILPTGSLSLLGCATGWLISPHRLCMGQPDEQSDA